MFWLALIITFPSISLLLAEVVNYLVDYSVYIPLGIIGLWRWTVWVIKRGCSLTYTPIISQESGIPRTTFSIITPVYKEDPLVFGRALESWEQNRPNELIAVIDQSDSDCIKVFEEFSIGRPWAKLIVTDKPGKREALVTGILSSKSEILALADSDTIWDHDIRNSILVPFDDPQIAGVTVRYHPIERRTVWQKVTDIFWDLRNYYDMPSQVAIGQAVSCLTGRTSLYRRKVILPRLDEFRNEMILGVRKESGEDKCLTRMIQREGWKSYYQMNAVVYSSAAEDATTFWNQRIRWARNSFNSDFVAIFKDGIWRTHPFLAFFMLDRIISMFTVLLGPIYFGVAAYQNHWQVAISILILWLVGRGIRIWPHLKRQPRDIFVLPAYVLVNFIYALAKLYALISLTEQKWIRDHPSIPDPKSPRKSKMLARIKNIAITSEILIVFVLGIIQLTKLL